MQHVLPLQLGLHAGGRQHSPAAGGDINDDDDGEKLREIVRLVMESLQNMETLSEAMREAVRAAYEVAVRWSLVGCLCFAVLAAVSSLLIREWREKRCRRRSVGL